MKKLILLLILCVNVLKAQEYNPAYKKELDGNYVPAQVMFSDGVVQDVKMEYQQPEFFKNPQNKFKIVTIDASGNEHNYNYKEGMVAFKIDGNVWAQRKVNGQLQFVILRSQGVIEKFESVINGKLGDVEAGAYIVFGDRTRLMTRNSDKAETIEGRPSDAKIREWIADSDPVKKDLKEAELAAQAEKKKQDSLAQNSKPKEAKKGLLGTLQKASALQEEARKEAAATVDMQRIVNNYNAWYEEQHQGNVKYYFVSLPMWKPLPKKMKSKGEQMEESNAKVESLFEGRPTSPSADLASAKENIPVKKETFTAKMQRIKSDGNRIGVLLRVRPVRVPKPEGSLANSNTFGESLPIEGEYMDESLKAAGGQIVQELNQALNTNDVELIDLSQIPYRDVKALGVHTKMDDWWATKYKVVFACTLDPQLKAIHDTFMKDKITFKADLNFICSLIVTEFIGAPTSTKQDIITQIQNLGNFTTSFSQDEDMNDVKQIYNKLLEKLNTPILEKMKTERVQGVKKLVEKKLAP